MGPRGSLTVRARAKGAGAGGTGAQSVGRVRLKSRRGKSSRSSRIRLGRKISRIRSSRMKDAGGAY